MIAFEKLLSSFAINWREISVRWAEYGDSEELPTAFPCDVISQMLGVFETEQIVVDIDAVLDRPDVYHQFTIQDHVFALIRYHDDLDQQHMYYCDYWPEARSTGAFRMEPISLQTSKLLIRDYLMGDLLSFVSFSSTDAAFIEQYCASYRGQAITCASRELTDENWLMMQAHLERLVI